ncbi:MAG: hypothetical protein NVS3B28_27660 [Candidatus Velthaea sp.]
MKPLIIAVAAAAFAYPVAAGAQAMPAPDPSATPSAIGPALFNNDPCTTLEAIVTRPTVTNAVCTVRPNHVLIETGYQNTTADGSGGTVQYPQALIRVGTKINGLEGFVALPTAQRVSGGGPTLTGATDIAGGIKFVFGATPKFAYGAQAQISAPTGTNAFSANGTTSIYALNLGYTLNSVFSLGSALQAQSLVANSERYSSFVPSLVLTAALPQRTAVYGEIAQFSHATGPATPTRTQYIFGAYRVFAQRLQLDLEGGFSPTVVTGKYHYVGFGVSYYL